MEICSTVMSWKYVMHDLVRYIGFEVSRGVGIETSESLCCVSVMSVFGIGCFGGGRRSNLENRFGPEHVVVCRRSGGDKWVSHPIRYYDSIRCMLLFRVGAQLRRVERHLEDQGSGV